MDEYVCVINPNLTYRPVDRIVRCRDCGWSCYCEGETRCEHFHFYEVDPDGFCAWGERRGE